MLDLPVTKVIQVIVCTRQARPQTLSDMQSDACHTGDRDAAYSALAVKVINALLADEPSFRRWAQLQTS